MGLVVSGSVSAWITEVWPYQNSLCPPTQARRRPRYRTHVVSRWIPCSERLGRASVGITLDTYLHAIPAMQEEAAERIASFIFD